MGIWPIRKAELTVIKGRDDNGEVWYVCRNGRPVHACCFITFDAALAYKETLERD